jgi:hypothetical protein
MGSQDAAFGKVAYGMPVEGVADCGTAAISTPAQPLSAPTKAA